MTQLMLCMASNQLNRMMKHCLKLILCLYATCVFAKTTVESMRLWPSPESTRVVFDLSNTVKYSVFTLHNPERVVIDLEGADLDFNVDKLDLVDSALSKVRVGTPSKDKLRVVFDLSEQVLPKSFLLKPNTQYGNRLVVDLNRKTQAPTPVPLRQYESMTTRDFIVAVDAGHGGEDPGATGRRGTKEKIVVLQIARLVAKKINKLTNMKAVLIRDGDYYIGLRQRINKARKAQADLFVSIHADAFKNSKAKGASVFTLSSHGASSEAARWLAEQENRADLVGGVSLDDKDDMLASVLLDLSQTASNEASVQVAGSILNNLKGVSHIHSSRVQKAGFAVLKSPDIPSMLVETGFISNTYEEKKLASYAYQNKLADAIVKGIAGYFKDKPKPRINHSVLTYKVMAGDNLSKIAGRYKTTVELIKADNELNSHLLHVGQVLKIRKNT